MTQAEYQRQRRQRLRAAGEVMRLQSEIGTTVYLTLMHLATIHGRTVRAELEFLILEGFANGGH